MKEKIITFFNVVFIILSVVLIVYNLVFAPQPDWRRVAGILGVLVVWLASTTSALRKQRVSVERINRDAYGHILGDIFADRPRKYRKLMKGIELYNGDHLESAIRKLSPLLDHCESEKECAVVRFFVAASAMDAGLYHDAAEILELALQEDPTMADARNNLGVCYKMRGELEKARRTFDEVLIYDPRNAMTYVNLGQCYESQADWERSLYYAQEALRLNSNSLEAMAMGHLACERLGDRRNAERYREMFLVNGGTEEGLADWKGDCVEKS